ncbi:uncharacterized protein LOC129953709 [Eupeodes corollae]|uniref:uncharacterized protein LOC129953709 n=1 Tax=Eupeodes corollae TaxID=290404 RepID=UPI002491294D|nr:uncharacterized protein LOC129953709 [Eupeodes corollae]
MISRREKLLIYPWELQRYEKHRHNVVNAKPAIDVKTPLSYAHVTIKLKKVQAERERLERIEKENVRLLQKLGDIMGTKRLKNFWKQSRPDFLNREKLFNVRPKTCKITNKSSGGYQDFDYERFGSYKRCQSCSGRPIQKVQKIPEERIPWQPPKKSWNIRNIEDYNVKKCLHCQKFI